MGVGQGVTIEQINEYTQVISKMPREEYVAMRRTLISDYIARRKRERDMIWYIKRLNLRYFNIIRNAKKNREKYHCCISQYLDKK